MASHDKPDDFFADELGEREGRAGFVQEFVKKAAVAGLGALFMTEEGIRNLAGQMKVPKEALAFLISGAEKTKDEIGRVLSEEVRRFLQSEKLREEFLKLLTGMTVEVTARVRLIPEEGERGGADAPRRSPKVVVTEINARRSKRPKKE